MTAEAAEAELGLTLSNPADKFVVVEFWVEADQYDCGAAYRTEADLAADMAGTNYAWY
jgi:hypothetical protein